MEIQTFFLAEQITRLPENQRQDTGSAYIYLGKLLARRQAPGLTNNKGTAWGQRAFVKGGGPTNVCCHGAYRIFCG
jgi:hypothetical protein